MPTSQTEDGYVYYDGELLGIKRPIYELFDQTNIRVVRYNDGMILHITDRGEFEEVQLAGGMTSTFIAATGLTGRTAQNAGNITSISQDEFRYKAEPLT